MTAIWDFLVHVVKTAPVAFWPCIVGFLIASIGTQWLKFMLREEWNKHLRASLSALMAFCLGFATTFVLWPTLYGGFAAAITGMAAPTVYAVGVRLIGLKWPAVRDLLSQDVRTQAAQERKP